MMTRTEFLRQFEGLTEERPGSLTGAESLKGGIKGWNSLAFMSFLAMLDEHFQMPLSSSEIEKIDECVTVNDLIAFLGDKISE
jgi:acyl carrier protein